MKTPLATLTAVMMVVSASLWSASASALWLGLADGDYIFTLTSCTNNSNPSICGGLPASGQMTVSGAGLSAMDITFDGVAFTGDPTDFVQSPFISLPDVRERSSIVNNGPFAFMSLLHEIGTLGSVLPFTNAYIYCNNDGAGCTPNTAGEWTATPLQTAVPEPSTLGLMVVALAGSGLMRRRRC